MERLVAVTFEPSGAVARVASGALVLDAAAEAGVVIPAPCGHRGVCGSCGVRVVAGALEPPDDTERAALRRAPHDVRLACRARIGADAVSLRPLFAASVEVEVRRAEAPRGGDLVAGVDLGTTSVGAAVAEASDGRVLAASSVPNEQQAEGADVLSRVSAALAGGAGRLQELARRSVRSAIETAAAGAMPRVRRVVVAGNTAMSALLAGVEVAALAAHPFDAPRYPTALPAEWLGDCGGDVEVHLLPPIASFVGGDALAGLVHTGMLHAHSPELLVDLGTNAEVALVADGRLWVASAPAGPAFEGGGVESGVQAVPGAVIGARLVDGDLEILTLGDDPPLGIAGSGLIALVAALRDAGAISAEGLIGSCEGPVGTRVFVGDDGVRRVRVDANGVVVLSQLDVRALQLAKAAVATAVRALLPAAGVRAHDLAVVHVAGAFGSALSTDALAALGILPCTAVDASVFVGNASLSGALAMALAPEIIEEARARAAGAHHLDLAASPQFNRSLLENLALEPYEG